MGDNFIRHLIALLGMLILVSAYISGYVSATHGWWWTIFACAIFYYVIYKLVDV